MNVLRYGLFRSVNGSSLKVLYLFWAACMVCPMISCDNSHGGQPVSDAVRHDVAVSISFDAPRLRAITDKQAVMAADGAHQLDPFEYISSFDLYFARPDGTIKAYLHSTPRDARTNLFEQGAEIFVDGAKITDATFDRIFRAFLIGKTYVDGPEAEPDAHLKIVNINPAVTKVAVVINGQGGPRPETVKNVKDLQMHANSGSKEMWYFDYKELEDAYDPDHPGIEPIDPSPQDSPAGFAKARVKAVRFGIYKEREGDRALQSQMNRFQVIDQFCVIQAKPALSPKIQEIRDAHPELTYRQAVEELKTRLGNDGRYTKTFEEFTTKLLGYHEGGASPTIPIKACVAYMRDRRGGTLLGLSKPSNGRYTEAEIDEAYGYPQYFTVELIGTTSGVSGADDYPVSRTILKTGAFLNHFYFTASVKGGAKESNTYIPKMGDMVYAQTDEGTGLPTQWKPLTSKTVNHDALNRMINDRLFYYEPSGFPLYNPSSVVDAERTYLATPVSGHKLQCFAFNYFAHHFGNTPGEEVYHKHGDGAVKSSIPVGDEHAPFIHFSFTGLPDGLKYVNIVGYKFEVAHNPNNASRDFYNSVGNGGHIINVNLGRLNGGFGAVVYSDDPALTGYARPDIKYNYADLTVTVRTTKWTEVDIINPNPSGIE